MVGGLARSQSKEGHGEAVLGADSARWHTVRSVVCVLLEIVFGGEVGLGAVGCVEDIEAGGAVGFVLTHGDLVRSLRDVLGEDGLPGGVVCCIVVRHAVGMRTVLGLSCCSMKEK